MNWTEIALEAVEASLTLSDQFSDPHPDCDCYWSAECKYHQKLLADIRIVRETWQAALAWVLR